jgi:hypothetical protein
MFARHQFIFILPVLKTTGPITMIDLTLITQPTEAEQLLRMALRDKRNLMVRKDSLSVRNENASEDGAERLADIAATQAELASANAMIASLPEGNRKEAEITKKMATEVRLRRLTQNGDAGSPLSIVERQYDAEILEREIAGIDAFIDAVNAHKATLN